MVWRIPPFPRNLRVRVLGRIQNQHSNYLRIHLLYPITPRAPNDHRIRLVPPNILLIILPLPENYLITPLLVSPLTTLPLESSRSILPLLENPLAILPHLANSPTILFLNPFLESRPNLATRAVPPRPQALSF